MLGPFVAGSPGPAEWESIITLFLRDHVRRAGAEGVVIGISGGLDSAVVAALCVRAFGKANVLGLLMPSDDSDPQDAADGQLLVDHLGIESRKRSITPIVRGLEEALDFEPNAYVHGNAKARARMMFLYAEAQGRNRLVCGTGNKSELLVGYFTKHGDGGNDLQPIGDLYKTQVFDLARHLGLPEPLITKPPSAGLHPGQTDEQDLGMSYEELDKVLKAIELNSDKQRIVERTGVEAAKVDKVWDLVRRSEHKRKASLVPKIGARTVGIDWRRPVHWDA